MGEKKILIDGEEYVSSARAAELVGYTKDYVGQLARNGKIEARRVGRNWYIKESSISKHKLSVHYTLTKPKKTKKKTSHEDEITIFRADLSTDIAPEKQEYTNEHTAQELEKSVNQSHRAVSAKHNEGEVDLFPKIRKYDSDILTKTDVRYIKDQKPEKKSKINDGYVPVSVRKPTMAGIVRKNNFTISEKQTSEFTEQQNKRNKLAPVDGVVRDRGIGMHPDPVRKENFDEYYEDREEHPLHYDHEYHVNNTGASGEKESSTSKVIPVIGAMVLFTIVAVIYILFFN